MIVTNFKENYIFFNFMEIYIYFQFSDFPFCVVTPTKSTFRFGFYAWQLWHDFCSCAFHLWLIILWLVKHSMGYKCISPLRDFIGKTGTL